MKPIVLLFLLSSCIHSLQAQTATDYQLSTGGIGPIKIGMSKIATEKLLNTKLILPKTAQKDSYEWDTVKVSYKEMELQLVFSRTYFGSDTAVRQGIYSIASSSPLVKTKSGIGIGDDKMKIVKTYEQYRLEILPEWIDSKPNPKRGTVTLYDNENPKVIIFHMDNNIITKVEAMQYEGE